MTPTTRLNREQDLAAAQDASDAASKLLMVRFKSSCGCTLKQWMKSPGALVTDADVAQRRSVYPESSTPHPVCRRESRGPLFTSRREGGGLGALAAPRRSWCYGNRRAERR